MKSVDTEEVVGGSGKRVQARRVPSIVMPSIEHLQGSLCMCGEGSRLPSVHSSTRLFTMHHLEEIYN